MRLNFWPIIHGSFLMQFCFPHELKPGEYGLSKDLDVALWLDCRTFHHEPPLPDIHDFVVINSQLHNEFDLFKKTNIRASYSLIPLCDLLTFYCGSKCRVGTKVLRYGKVYLELHNSEVDELIMWVDEMREKYFGFDGEKVFDKAALIMSTDDSTGSYAS